MKKLWQTETPLNPIVEKFTKGEDPELDINLLPFDIQGTIAHAKSLLVASVINKEEFREIRHCLYGLKSKALSQEITFPPGTEDCHSFIENWLETHLGDTGRKIHAGRSRNDQVLTALRLYQIAGLSKICTEIDLLNEALEATSTPWQKQMMPGFSHGRQGMPVSLTLWFTSWKELLKEDQSMCKAAMGLLNKSPLGAGAGFGNSLNLNRKFVAESLGFNSPINNPLAAMGRRGKDELLCLQALSQTMITAGKLASELLNFTSESYGYFSLPQEFLTGSSMMPNKTNYDLLEIIRGNASLVNGYSTQVTALISSLGSGYHRDFQLAKSAMMTGLNLSGDSLEILTMVIKNLKVHAKAITASISKKTEMTLEVEKLVKDGIPFRQAYLMIKKGNSGI